MSIGSINGSGDATLALTFLRQITSQNVNSATPAPAPTTAAQQSATTASNVTPLALGDAGLTPANATVAAFTASGVTTMTTNDPVAPTMTTNDPVAPIMTTSDPVGPSSTIFSPVAPTMSTSDPVAPSSTIFSPVAPTLTTNDPVAPSMTTSDPVVPTLTTNDPVQSGPVGDPFFHVNPKGGSGFDNSVVNGTSPGSTNKVHHGRHGHRFGQFTASTDGASSTLSEWLQAAGVPGTSKLSTTA